MFVHYAAVITKLKWNVSDLCDSVHKLHALSNLLWVYLTKSGSLRDSGKFGSLFDFGTGDLASWHAEY